MWNFWTILCTLFIGYIVTSYFKFWRSVAYFRNNNISFKQPIWIFGNMFRPIFRKCFFYETIEESYKIPPKMAKYVGFFDFSNPVIVVRDPDLIKQICVKHWEHFADHRGFVDDKLDPLFGLNIFQLKGQKWHNIRTMLSPAFTSSKMKMMFQLMDECASNFADYMLQEARNGKNEVELKDIFTRFTNDVIATCAFGIRTDSLRDRKNDFYVLGRRATNIDGIFSLKIFLLRSFPFITKAFKFRLIDNEVSDFFVKAIGQTIATRDQQNISRPDMLQLMMDARGKVNELNLVEMTAQAFIFFFGGFDTTSTLMCFVAHEIATNPVIHKKLQQEVDEIWEKTNGKLNYDVLNQMQYLDAVINEALRMYPPALFTDRVCTKEFELPPNMPGDKPLTIKPGTNIWFPVYSLHHDEEHFAEPEKFDPNRFYDKVISTNHPAYMPFGLGPRMCIGNRFALQEIKIVIFYLLMRCNFTRSPKTHVPMQYSRSSFALLSKGGFYINLEPRKDKLMGFYGSQRNGSVTA